MKKPTKKRAMARALKAMSDYTRERDNFTCFTCSKKGDKYNMDAGHFFSRVYKAILFTETNVHCQCYGCNKFKGGNWAEYYDRFIEKYGKEEFERLATAKHVLKKWTVEELLDKEEYFKEKLAVLNE